MTNNVSSYQSGRLSDLALAFLNERNPRALEGLNPDHSDWQKLRQFLKLLKVKEDDVLKKAKDDVSKIRAVYNLVPKAGFFTFELKDGQEINVEVEYFPSITSYFSDLLHPWRHTTERWRMWCSDILTGLALQQSKGQSFHLSSVLFYPGNATGSNWHHMWHLKCWRLQRKGQMRGSMLLSLEWRFAWDISVSYYCYWLWMIRNWQQHCIPPHAFLSMTEKLYPLPKLQTIS